ncbi:hypothetical protein A3A46_02560 [Candidatus Roizmanbacteria bacterium RIFCSPLOWO2_01_FULL_37_13]|uniref:Uncharacterized protein n=1 Tax=Candidatus Roizmanbacteria bacterium RIFCSPHIGHO2_02_FULL_38_11 TaxID=1802039 RepID=A0A1F7H5D5_9BACT|nr:MAG: hypothetical protein A3C25_04125 [Candidatus Roizmanbacteria bacterium RIFCSPHIGHO2_02_FULL_38_11]OGK33438.1 MAG: hypothetical protein A3F58_02105 [Candidatus Roizmanbacteria bacterium RIFCSPHIGHO2_12_FULL_37_9b]OGK41455.1 MAG: hypothetical protein A3A46_02560 [Candidatus Roizmanbacteria bacterium RIFCSPLOWO2_01_FULL_37_13]
MCFLRPLKVKKIKGKKALLENGIKAIYDKKVGRVNVNDLVMVYGNLIIQKIEPKQIRYE